MGFWANLLSLRTTDKELEYICQIMDYLSQAREEVKEQSLSLWTTREGPPQHFKYFTLLFCLIGFWAVVRNSYLCSSVSEVCFLSGFFQNFSLCLILCSLKMICLGIVVFCVFFFEEGAFILLAPSWLSGSAILCLMLISLRKFPLHLSHFL